MNKFSVLIADDEPIQRKIMQDYCIKSRFFHTVSLAKDGVEALELLNQTHYDLLLLDINMPLLSGLSLARSVKKNTKIIFVTAYSEHAVEAFELNVIDYLLKPVSFERFIKAIQKLIPEEQTQPASSGRTFIHVKQGKKILKVNLEDILYCESKGNNTRIFLESDTQIDVYLPLIKLQEELPNEMFTRIHRAFIVNNHKITAIENSMLYIGSKTIPIGASYKEGLEKWL
ncbi:MAG: LytTR family DNA-binding domain-containing protein [Flavobacteriales bacterium]|nr:LytTR family DNA-binding domain-containing protein [Flavobacteriales bacterium]